MYVVLRITVYSMRLLSSVISTTTCAIIIDTSLLDLWIFGSLALGAWVVGS